MQSLRCLFMMPYEMCIRDRPCSCSRPVSGVVSGRLEMAACTSPSLSKMASHVPMPSGFFWIKRVLTLCPVSYTHLIDCFVCNQQEAGLLFSDDYDHLSPDEMCRVLTGNGRSANIPSMVAVSYTHLDVYKRQQPCQRGTFQRAVDDQGLPRLRVHTCLLYTSRCV